MSYRVISLVLLFGVLLSCGTVGCSRDTREDVFLSETVYPEVFASTMEFKLSDEDVSAFIEQIEVCRRICLKNRKGDAAALKSALYQLDSMRAAIAAEREIACILYYYDLSDETARENYSYAQAAYGEVYNRFWSFLNQMRNDGGRLSYVVEEFVTEAHTEPEEAESGAANDYYLQMQAIKTEFEKFNGVATAGAAHTPYTQYLLAANAYAAELGYDNY